MRPAARVPLIATALAALVALAACSGGTPVPPTPTPSPPSASLSTTPSSTPTVPSPGTASPTAPAPSGTPSASATADAPATGSTAAPTRGGTAPTPASSAGPRSLAVLGDSISRAADACSFYGDCPSLSWATGTDGTIDSLAARLASRSHHHVTTYNDARSGANVSDLPRQVGVALAQHPDVVVVLLGANDACRATLADMTSVSTYAAIMRAQLQRLAAGLPHATVLLASVPDVPRLLPVVLQDRTARFFWQRTGGCRTPLAAASATAADVAARSAAISARISDYNAAAVAACATRARCVDDGGALFDFVPTLSQLSELDYFHPSPSGQARLAALEWGSLEQALF